MHLKSKISLFFSFIAIGLVAVVTAISLYAFKEFSVDVTQKHVRTASEIVRVHLTESMINATIDKRQSFLRRITEVHGLLSAYVVRSPVVDEQYGTSVSSEDQPDEIEKEVMETGENRFKVEERGSELIFRSTIPYIADSRDTPNCMQCHVAKEGDVLGAVTMTMSLTSLRNQALLTVCSIVGTVALFVTVLLFFLRGIISPIANTARGVEEVVRAATNGNFKGNIVQKSNDEVGQIATEINRLMRFLDDGLNHIGRQVSQLTGRQAKENENLLAVTIDMVEGLTKASRFKQAIEEDEAKAEIFQRLSAIFQDEFDLHRFSIYEVLSGQNEMKVVIVDGMLQAPCRWCNPQILERPESCRARRTGHLVNGLHQPDICYAFNPSMVEDGSYYNYLCFPVIQSGIVGSIVQLVVREDEKDRVSEVLPYINVYLREAAPVLEARRLTETLKESSLRDPMTGLNNRRYLEEYIETLLANVRRQQIHLAIMMLDLDYFKMVNDTYGHDAGDSVLKALSEVLKQAVRSSDMVIRYGGEEFLIILQDTEEPDADQVAENIRSAVEKIRVNAGGTVLQKTISIGLSDYPKDSTTFWQAIKFADVALYNAKQTGRNRVVRFNQEMWTDNPEY
ncbi:MAG: diguanylate cyclase [Zoogloeaceae bacterium]|jgi:diguanylate cyclase (GGDEF)-like protein|nr:diguanylate cyclase [Zoogloeaceae bacterium]